MIIDLPSTNSSKINRALVDLREKGGSITLGRVLTLVIVTDDSAAEDPIAAANAASFEHPCRVIVVARGRAGRATDGRPDPGRWRRRRIGSDGAPALRHPGRPRRVRGRAVAAGRRTGGRLVAGGRSRGAGRGSDRCAGPAADHRRRRRQAARRAVDQRIASYRPGDTDLSWTEDHPVARPAGRHPGPAAARKGDRRVGRRCRGLALADLLAAWLAVR